MTHCAVPSAKPFQGERKSLSKKVNLTKQTLSTVDRKDTIVGWSGTEDELVITVFGADEPLAEETV